MDGVLETQPELLLSDDFVDVVNALRDQYDYILMDTPPILAVSDPANASACSDGIILTLRLRRNLRPIAIRAAQMLQSVNANLLGVVINGVTGRAGYGYGGYRYDGSRTSAGLRWLRVWRYLWLWRLLLEFDGRDGGNTRCRASQVQRPDSSDQFLMGSLV